MSIFDEPKIDCHNHVFDPAGFPYRPDTPYRPSGQEVSTAKQFRHVMDCYGVQYALVVGPNSGYSTDSSPVFDAIDRSNGRCKGISVVRLDIPTKELADLKARGIVGIAFNSTIDGVEYYLGAHDLLARLADLDMILQIQAEKDQLAEFHSLLANSPVRIAIDHCGRPDISAGLGAPGFQALLEAFTTAGCVWASDWPFVKATERIDYGPLLKLFESFVPDPADRRKILWDTPCRWFGFPASNAQIGRTS